jgi:APA family basic amino acid/polyamine antiporter
MGTLAVVAIYLLINVSFLRTFGLVGLASTKTPAADAATAWFGAPGGRFVAAAIAASAFGFINLAVLAPTRVYYAMAADGAFWSALSRLHPRYGTPSAAIVLQSAWAILLTITGTYDQLVDSVVFADWIFFGLTVSGLFVLRPRLAKPDGYRTPGYPWLPASFVVVALAVVYSSIRESPERSAVGAGLLLAGIPVFYLFKWLSRTTGTKGTKGTTGTI